METPTLPAAKEAKGLRHSQPQWPFTDDLWQVRGDLAGKREELVGILVQKLGNAEMRIINELTAAEFA